MSTWINEDGLTVRFDKDRLNQKKQSGAYNFGGPTETIEIFVNLADLTATNAVIEEGVRLPTGYLLESAELAVDEVGAGGSAIDIGIVAADRTTEVDYNGVIAAAATSAVNAVGKQTVATGALVGTVLNSKAAYVTGKVAGTLFTAGKARVRLVVRKI